MTTFVGHLVSRRMEKLVCLCFTCSFYIALFVYSSALSFSQISAITKLNGTNYKKLIKSLRMNLTIMKLNLALKVEAHPKHDVESYANEKSSMRTVSILIIFV